MSQLELKNMTKQEDLAPNGNPKTRNPRASEVSIPFGSS